jgi:hypothetical protein
MADNAPIKGGLSTDPRAINFYGAQDADISEYQKSLDDSIKALQQRYAQPNWFNVAAGFFKPQLGGFAASLGSASAAMGQNVERERESQLPIAQMRSQLAMSKIAMGQNKQAADLIKAHEAEDAPLYALPQLAAKLKALGSPLADSVNAQIDQTRKSQDLQVQRVNSAIAQRNAQESLINRDEAQGVLTPAEAAIKRALLPDIPTLPPDPFEPPARVDKNAPVKEPAAAPPPPAAAAGETGAPPPAAAAGETGAPPPAAVSAAAPAPDAAVPSLTAETTEKPLMPKLVPGSGFNPKDAGTAQILNEEMAKVYPRAISGTDERAQNDLAALVREAARIKLFPSTEGLSAVPAAAAPAAKPAKQERFPVMHARPTGEGELRGKSPDERALIIKAAEEKAKADESRADGLVKKWSGYGDPTIYTPYMGELSQSISMIEGNKPVAKKVFNVMGQGDLQAQLLKAANEGFTFNGGVWSGSVNLPVKAWVDAGLLAEEATYANKMATMFLRINGYKGQLQNMSTSNPPVAEFSALQNRGANLGQTWDAALSTLKKDRINGYWSNKIYNIVLAEKEKAGLGELAPTAAVIKHSKEYKAADLQWQKDLQAIK